MESVSSRNPTQMNVFRHPWTQAESRLTEESGSFWPRYEVPTPTLPMWRSPPTHSIPWRFEAVQPRYSHGSALGHPIARSRRLTRSRCIPSMAWAYTSTVIEVRL